MSADNPNGPATSDAIDYKSKYEEAEKRYTNLRTQFNQRDEEIRAARATRANQRTEAIDYDQSDDQPQPRRYKDDDLEKLDFRTARNEFLLMNNDGRDYWGRINEVLADQSRVSQFAAWDENGRPNFERTIRDIYRDLKFSEIEQARAKAAAATPAPTRPSPTLAPIISGGSSVMDSSLPNPEDMTDQDLFNAVQSLGDPSDPIRGGAVGAHPSTSLR